MSPNATRDEMTVLASEVGYKVLKLQFYDIRLQNFDIWEFWIMLVKILNGGQSYFSGFKFMAVDDFLLKD